MASAKDAGMILEQIYRGENAYLPDIPEKC